MNGHTVNRHASTMLYENETAYRLERRVKLDLYEDKGLEKLFEFYDIFAKMDLEAMAAIWLPSENISCHHPGWQPTIGHTQVMAGWSNIMGQGHSFSIRYEHLAQDLSGDILWTTGKEHLQNAPHEIVTTNILKHNGGVWYMIHHHSSPIFAAQPSNDKRHHLN